jgi:phosphate transport system substrate-binding protein
MKVSMLAKSAAVALVFGLVASTPAHALDLSGSGASFPAGLIEACKAPYAASGAGNTYAYAASSSGTGRGNSDKSIGDFWFSDSAYTAATKRASLIHVPAVAAPVGILHNLPSRNELALSASTITGIFAGTITRWNDPAIIKDNNRAYNKIVYKTKGGVIVKDEQGNPVIAQTIPTTTRYTLPDKPIKVIYRFESSGTSENFTNYLNKTTPTVWPNAKNGTFATSFPGNLNSPENLGRMVSASSSTGVAQLAAKTPYSITYAETSYAAANRLKIASVINASGNAVAPTSSSVAAFLSQASMDKDGIVTFDYATKEKGAYTLGIVSYMLVDTAYPTKAQAAAVKSVAEFLVSSKCATTVGGPLGFATLDGEFLKKAQAQIAKIG